MNIGAAFDAMLQDRDWVMKLVIAGVIAFLAGVTAPILIGLVGSVILLGYQVEIVRRARDRSPAALPLWQNFETFLSEGALALLAIAIYLLPLIVVMLIVVFSGGLVGGGGAMSILVLGVSCLLLPLTLIYSFVALAMHTIGMGLYAHDRRGGVYFDVQTLLAYVLGNTSATFQYAINLLLLSVITAVIALVPCIGWIIAPAISVFIGGMLAGQYAAAILDGEKPKRGGDR
jgi:hypothetical protein